MSKQRKRAVAFLMAVMPLATILVAMADMPVASAFGVPGLNLQVITPSPPAQDVYISDQGNNRVLKVTPAGVQTAVGTGLSAPSQLAVDAAGDVYIADSDNNRVVKVTPAGTQKTVLGGLNAPEGVAVDAAGDVYIADTNNSRVIEISATGQQTSIGTGFTGPTGVVVDSAGDVFVSDEGNSRVVEVFPGGSQKNIGMGFFGPQGIGLDPAGDVYVADTKDDLVKEVTPAGITSRVYPPGTSKIVPDGVSIDAAGDLLLTDFFGDQVLEVTPSGAVHTIGSGLSGPYSVVVGPVGPTKTIARQSVSLTADLLPVPSGPTGAVQFFDGSTLLGTAALAVNTSGNDQATLTITSLPIGPDTVTAAYGGDFSYTALTATVKFSVQPATSGLALEVVSPPPPAADVYIADTGNNRVLKVTPSGTETTVGSGLSAPTGVAVDAAGDVYIAEATGIVEVTPSGTQATVGSGLSGTGVAVDAAGDVFVADPGDNSVVKVTPAGKQSTVESELGAPFAVASDPAGDAFVAEEDNNRIIEVTPIGTLTVPAIDEGGTPQGVATDDKGDVFAAWTANNRIARYRPDGLPTMLLATGLSSPEGLAVDNAGNVYIADTGHDRVLVLSSSGMETTIGSGLKSPSAVAIGQVAAAPATSGSRVTLAASAFPAGAGGPTGSVTFSLGSTVLGTVGLTENAAGTDRASLVTTTLPAGADDVTAKYSGDSVFAASSAGAPISVAKAASTTAVKLSVAKVIYGDEQAEHLSVTISSHAVGLSPTGRVTVTESATTLCTITLSSAKGSCTLSAAALTTGNYHLVAAYGGDADFIGSTSPMHTLTVAKASSKTALKLSETKVTYGNEQVEHLSVAVSPQYPGSIPTGTVTVKESVTKLCTITLSSAKGSCTLGPKMLNAGTYHLVATYGGSMNFGASITPAATLTVVQ